MYVNFFYVIREFWLFVWYWWYRWFDEIKICLNVDVVIMKMLVFLKLGEDLYDLDIFLVLRVNCVIEVRLNKYLIEF